MLLIKGGKYSSLLSVNSNHLIYSPDFQEAVLKPFSHWKNNIFILNDEKTTILGNFMQLFLLFKEQKCNCCPEAL